MVTWADADAAVEAERTLRIKRVENATLITALTLLLCAVWLAWPSLRGLMNGDGVVLTSFGAPLVVLIWGIFVQDLTLDDPAARSRVASATTVAWPLLMALGALGFHGPPLRRRAVVWCWYQGGCVALFRTERCGVILASFATAPSSPASVPCPLWPSH